MYTVLVCDDSTFMRNIIKSVFYKLDLNIEVIGEASNGLEAIDKYKELKPDFVTMDIIMDKTNGLEALTKIIDFDKNAKIIMISSMGQKCLIKEAIDLGAIDFIIKPFDFHLMKKTFYNQISNINRKEI